jgi:hypothetical protein
MQLRSVTWTVAAALLATRARADGPTNTFNSSDLMSLNTTGPHFVDQTTRNAWCTSQRSACSTLCGGGMGDFASNDCDANALTWNCTCSSNHSAPGLQWYATTMPNNLCNVLNGDCMADQAQNGQVAQQNCNSTYVCSNINITTYGKSAASSAASASSSPSATGSSSGASPTSSKGAAVALHVGEHYGSSLLGAGLVAALGYLL